MLYAHRDAASAAEEIAQLSRTLDLFAPGRRALDLGCGNGRHAVALIERGVDLIGLDLSAPLLDQARRRPGLDGRLVKYEMY